MGVAHITQSNEDLEEDDERLLYLDEVFPLEDNDGMPLIWLRYVQSYEYSFCVSDVPRFAMHPTQAQVSKYGRTQYKILI